MVCFVPTELERQEVGNKVGEEYAADGGDAEDDVAPYDAGPLVQVSDVEYAGVVEVEECLCSKEQKQSQEGFAKQVSIYVAGYNPAAFVSFFHLGR